MFKIYAVCKIDLQSAKTQQGQLFSTEELAEDWVAAQADQFGLAIMPLEVHTRTPQHVRTHIMYNRFTREPLIESLVTEDIGVTAVKTLCIECGHEGLVIIFEEGIPYSAWRARQKTERQFLKHSCKMRSEMVGSGW